MNPYQVLGVSRKASDEDVKKAYRNLARKYHPDKYVGSAYAAEAETHMKEINEAYDTIIRERKAPHKRFNLKGLFTEKRRAYEEERERKTQIPQQYEDNIPLYQRIRQTMKQENFSMAAALLQRVGKRDAEWYFLSGEVYYAKGWYDEADRAYQKACKISADNREYQSARERARKARCEVPI